MGFPIQFAERKGDYDFISGPINFVGNGLVIAVGGISLGFITAYALKALGFGKTVTKISTAIPITIGLFAAVVAIGGCLLVGAIAVAVGESLGKRLG